MTVLLFFTQHALTQREKYVDGTCLQNFNKEVFNLNVNQTAFGPASK